MNKYLFGIIFGGIFAVIGGLAMLTLFFAPHLLGGPETETGNFYIATGCLFSGALVFLLSANAQRKAERYIIL